MPGLLQLAPESIDHIASYLEPTDATSFACTRSTFREAGQRSVFRSAVFRNGAVDERLLQFLRSLYGRPDMGKYVMTLHVEPVLPIPHLGQREKVLRTIDGLWVHLPGLRRLTLLWHSSLEGLTFAGCTDSLVTLSVTQCTRSVQDLLRRNRALAHISVLGWPENHSAALPVPADAAPHLRSIRAELDTLRALVPGRDITVLCISQPVTVEMFMHAAPALAQSTAQLRKLYLCFSMGSELASLAKWGFMDPLARHMPSLTSLTIKFALTSFEYDNVLDMCANLPSALKALQTLRLWLPGPLHNTSWKDRYQGFTAEGVEDDLHLVQRARERCPALRHASFFHRVDWHLVQPAGEWVPLVRGSHKRTVQAWLGLQDPLGALAAAHERALDAVETDSMVSEPADYVEYEPSTSGDESDSESESGESALAGLSDAALVAELQELENEDRNLPPEGSGLSEDAWAEYLEEGRRERTFPSSGPVPDPDIAALLEEVEEAAHLGMTGE